MMQGSGLEKSYPVTPVELYTLGALGFIASLLFSVSVSCFGFYSDTMRDLAFTQNVPLAVATEWDTLKNVAFWAGIGSFIAGVLSIAGGAITIAHVKNRTKFNDQS